MLGRETRTVSSRLNEEGGAVPFLRLFPRGHAIHFGKRKYSFDAHT